MLYTTEDTKVVKKTWEKICKEGLTDFGTRVFERWGTGKQKIFSHGADHVDDTFNSLRPSDAYMPQ